MTGTDQACYVCASECYDLANALRAESRTRQFIVDPVGGIRWDGRGIWQSSQPFDLHILAEETARCVPQVQGQIVAHRGSVVMFHVVVRI